MARNFDTIPLNPVAVGCAPACPPGPRPGTIAPIISVTSVNGESGDVILKGLFVGNKFYNGSSIVSLEPADLGLQKAFKYQKELRTAAAVEAKMADAEVGEIYYCVENTLFYVSVGEGSWKTFAGGEHFKEFSKIVDTASAIKANIDEDFMLTLELFDKKGNLFFTSEPVEIPYDFDDIIKDGFYDAVNKELVFVLKNGKEIRIPVSGLIDGLQKEITDENPLEFRLVRGLQDFKTDIYAKLNTEVEARSDADSAEIVARQQAIEAASAQSEAKINVERDARIEAVASERNDRTLADTAIRNDMNTAIANIRADLANETTARQTKDTELSDKIDDEVIGRKHADTVLTEKLNTEIAERKEADTTEKTAREADTAELANRIAIEKSKRIEADTQLTTALNGVQSALTEEINTRISDVNILTQNLTAEISERFTQDQALKTAINTEKAAREAKDAELEQKLNEEIAARISVDDALIVSLNDEANDRASADAAEKQAREAADAVLQQNINTEANIRESSDNIIRADLATERTNRINNDNEIKANLATEAQVRADADIVLQGNINAEANTRAAADANLQDQINRVPTYGMIKDDIPSSEAYSATYHLTMTKDGVTQNVGTPINIAKDFLVREAHLKTVSEPDVPYPGAKVGDKYIDLVINVKSGSPEESHIYLPVQDLVDIYTGGYGIVVEGYKIRLSDEFTHRVSNIEEDLIVERTTRINNETQIKADLAAEASTRQQEDISIKAEYRELITNEITARQNADIALQQDYRALVSNEEASRIARDNEITAAFNEALNAEVIARTAADNTMQADYNSKFATEAEVRSNADNGLQIQITKNKNDIAEEALNRENADAALYALILEILNKKTSYVAQILGNGVTTYFTVTHGLSTENVIVQVSDTTGKTVLTDVQRTGKNTVAVTFKEAPEVGKKYNVMCYGIVGDLASVKISFDANGGTGEMSPVYVAVGGALVLPQCLFTAPVGKEFDKWAIGSVSGEQHMPGETCIFTEATTLYALWRESTGTFYYGDVPTSVLTSKSISALDSMVATQRSAQDLLTNGARNSFDCNDTVPVFAVNNNLGITCKTFWTTDESYVLTPYSYSVGGFTFFCNSADDGSTPAPLLGETLLGMTFKTI